MFRVKDYIDEYGKLHLAASDRRHQPRGRIVSVAETTVCGRGLPSSYRLPMSRATTSTTTPRRWPTEAVAILIEEKDLTIREELVSDVMQPEEQPGNLQREMSEASGKSLRTGRRPWTSYLTARFTAAL